jgi:peptidoglycan hydrolase-like protein with peptidoglycan-binding domain
MTEGAVKAWQDENKLTADGIVGPKTYAAMIK